MQRTVLKVDIACVKCKKKLLKAVSAVQGVDRVEIDETKGTLTVTGSGDPYEVIVRARKTGKHVEVVSIGPPPPPPKPQAEGGQQQQQPKKPDDKKAPAAGGGDDKKGGDQKKGGGGGGGQPKEEKLGEQKGQLGWPIVHHQDPSNYPYYQQVVVVPMPTSYDPHYDNHNPSCSIM
ncbi:unnamed protein product [Linum trigynum]|uniref:HMA domain-containing protein n=1 Tax=Linum trigynum TaxID=586398 RepID=A0AAV2F147_9ROSI